MECKAQECATMSFFAHLPNVKDPGMTLPSNLLKELSLEKMMFKWLN